MVFFTVTLSRPDTPQLTRHTSHFTLWTLSPCVALLFFVSWQFALYEQIKAVVLRRRRKTAEGDEIKRRRLLNRTDTEDAGEAAGVAVEAEAEAEAGISMIDGVARMSTPAGVAGMTDAAEVTNISSNMSSNMSSVADVVGAAGAAAKPDSMIASASASSGSMLGFWTWAAKPFLDDDDDDDDNDNGNTTTGTGGADDSAGGEWKSGRLRTDDALLVGAMAGTMSAFVTNPLDVITCRLMTQRMESASLGPGAPVHPFSGQGYGSRGSGVVYRYAGIWDCAHKIWMREGMRGLFSGWQPRVLRMGSLASLQFCAYETIRGLFWVESDYS